MTYVWADVLPGQVADDAAINALGNAVEANDTAITILSASRWVAETYRTVGSATWTTTEIVLDSVTFAATPTNRYKITWCGYFQSTVAGDLAQINFRYAPGVTVTPAATFLRGLLGNCSAANKGEIVTMVATVTGLSGQYCIGALGVRNSGTGVMVSAAGAQFQDTLLVEII